MSFVQAKCPECGGMLAVDDSKKAAVCQFCGEAFIVQEAINNYITNNITNNNTTHNYGDGATVNVYEDKNKDFVIEAGVLKEYHGAAVDVIIPDSVVEIVESCFKNLKIKSVIIPNSVKSIGDGVFEGCTNLKSIIIPNSVTTIGESAFTGCESLTSVTIPNSVTSIGSGAFSGCTNLTSVTIPNSVTSIYGNAFVGCVNLKSINVDENNKNYFSKDGVLIHKYKNDNAIIQYPVGKSEAEYVMPNCVTVIDSNAFNGCKNLVSVIISNNVNKISVAAFEGCKSLEFVTIPNSVTSIGFCAFYYCTNLRSISIPNSITSIDERAFEGCIKLASISIPDSVTSIGEHAFKGCSNLTTVMISETYPICSFRKSFDETAFAKFTKKISENRKSKQITEWKSKGLCQYCGGEFKGIFTLKCRRCGKSKDY